MAQPQDYVGQRFGNFLVEACIAHGAEAEVFQCLHTSTGLRYVMRLGVNDEAIWEGNPLNPPRNYSLERANVRGSWYAALSYNTIGVKVDGEKFQFAVVSIYGVIDNRYLVPVASPVRVKKSWDIDQILRCAPANDLFLFKMWEDVVLPMISGAYSESPPPAEWEEQWHTLAGGPILTQAMAGYLDGGSLSNREKETVLRNVKDRRVEGRELAENILLRLCGCIERGRMSVEEAKATLSCKHFRINITQAELVQMLSVYAILKNEVSATDSVNLLQFIFTEMTKAPLDPHENQESFEVRSEQPKYEHFELFLQEYAGVKQDLLRLVPQ